MRKSWPFYLAVIVVGSGAGVAIAGRPSPEDPFVIDPSSITSTSELDPVTGAPDADDQAASATSLASITTVAAAVDSAAPTIAPSASTTVATTTTTTTVAEPELTLPDRSEVRLVLANGDGRARLASINADRMLAAGYTQIEVADVATRNDVTQIYYRPGFEVAALRMRDDLQTPNAAIAVLAAQPITDIDAAGDLIVVLGPDALR